MTESTTPPVLAPFGDLAAGAPSSPIPPVPPAIPEATSPAPEPASAAEQAFKAYGDSRAWTAHNGELIPSWEAVGLGVQTAWHHAARAVQLDMAHKLAEGLTSARKLVANPGASLPTPTGETPDAAYAVTSWFGHLVAEAERAEQTIRTWLAPSAERAAAEALDLVTGVMDKVS